MAASAKSLSLAAELKDALVNQGFVASQSFDTDGAPLVRVGSNAAAGQQTALIKVKQIDPLGTNIIGQAAVGYTPHVAQLVLETSATADLAVLTEANTVKLYMSLLKFGMRVELYMSANGNATGPEDITAGNLKATVDPDPKWKTMSSQ